jgi:DNA-binding transcriptional LysR family regulator
MDLHHLRTFVVIAQERSFTKAAARLHISQPPLSRHIRQLEDTLGVQLFARNRQRVDLTTEGKVLLSKAKAVVDGTDDIVKVATELRVGAAGTVKIGLASGLWDVALAIRSRYAAGCTHVTLDVADLGSGNSADALITQTVDVGLTRGEPRGRTVMAHRLFEEHLVVMLPATHPLANRSSVTLSALAGETVAMSQSVVSDRVLELYAHAAKAPPATIDCPVDLGIDAMRMVIASGRAIGFAVESPWTDSARVGGIATVRLDAPGASIPVHLSWRKDEQSAAVLALIDCARRTFVDGILQPMPSRPTAAATRTSPDVHMRVHPAPSQTGLAAQKLAVC